MRLGDSANVIRQARDPGQPEEVVCTSSQAILNPWRALRMFWHGMYLFRCVLTALTSWCQGHKIVDRRHLQVPTEIIQSTRQRIRPNYYLPSDHEDGRVFSNAVTSRLIYSYQFASSQHHYLPRILSHAHLSSALAAPELRLAAPCILRRPSLKPSSEFSSLSRSRVTSGADTRYKLTPLCQIKTKKKEHPK